MHGITTEKSKSSITIDPQKKTAPTFHKSSIIKKTVEVGSSTLLSRLLGLVREVLLVNFFGAGIASDAFFTAYKIPNALRKIFAEGALNAVFVPKLVAINKQQDRHAVNSIMTLSFLIFEGSLILLCILIFLNAETVIRLIAPGWFHSVTAQPTTVVHLSLFGKLSYFFSRPEYTTALPEAHYASTYLRILIAFIVFISSSALLAGALHAVNFFTVTALSPVLLNLVFIGGILLCLKCSLSINALCYCILFGGFLHFLLHLVAYLKCNFSFAPVDKAALQDFKSVILQFFPCLISMSISEVNLFVSTSLATYLPHGSISLIYYANRFLGIPLGVFSTAFSSILLPYFSHVHINTPRRLGFYFFEATKLIFWATLPTTLIMSFLSHQIFCTILLSKKFTLTHVAHASQILVIFLSGLFCFSLNKIMLNIYYSRQDTKTPVLISLASAPLNYIFSIALLPSLGAHGLAIAMVLASAFKSVLFAIFLYRIPHFAFYGKHFFLFVLRTCLQVGSMFAIFVGIFNVAMHSIKHICTPSLTYFLTLKIGFWFWGGPLCLFSAIFLFKTRKSFKISLYFLS